MRKVCLFSCLLNFVLAPFCWGDLLVETHQPNRQDRFYVGADKDFLGQAFDWSGVGQTAGGTWATMISPSYFVSAAHYHPGAGEVLTFHQNNDPSGPVYQATVSSWSYQTSFDGLPSDLWLGKLETPIPTSAQINYFPVATLADGSDYLGQMIYVNGRPNRVGRNNIDRITSTQEPDPPAAPYKNTVSMEFDYNTVSGLGADECYLISGDSGGPSFLDVNGQLALVGIHYYNSGPPSNGLISGDSFVPYYVDQLDVNMAGERLTATVPVPGLIAWTGGGKAGATDWSSSANWDPNTAVPNGPGTKVGFGHQLAVANVVDMISQGETVGSLLFFAGTETIIRSSGGFSLTLDNAGSASTIDVEGVHEISAPVILNNDATFSGTGTLDLTGGISGDYSLNVTSGTLNATSIVVDTLVIGSGLNTAQTVPEPATFVLLAFGAAGLLFFAPRCKFSKPNVMI